MVVGTIIGTAIFLQPAEVTRFVPTVGGALAVWAASGVLTMCGALVVAELASTFTQSGGVYVYLKEAFSPAVGFLWGWAMFWIMHSGIIAALAMVIARYAGALFPQLTDNGQRYVAISVILLLSAVNYVGVRHGSLLQALCTVGKLLAIAAIIVLGFAIGSDVPEHFVVSPGAGDTVGLREFGLAMVAGLFAFGGWHMVGYNAGETVEPRKTIPRALVIGMIVVTVCYMLLNTVYMYVLPIEQVASSERIAADLAHALLGAGAAKVMSALVIFSGFGALAGIVLAGPRVYYAMARDGLLFKWFGGVHETYRTPHRAIVLQGIWSAVLVATGRYEAVFKRVVYTEWIFFGLMAIGLFIVRRRRDVTRAYSVWGYPIVPGVFAAASFAVVINHVAAEFKDGAKGLSLVLIGLPVYYAWRMIRRKEQRAQTP